MNRSTLRTANNQLKTISSKRTLILENGEHICFQDLDFAGAGMTNHVWLYKNSVEFACCDLANVAGIAVYPWEYAN